MRRSKGKESSFLGWQGPMSMRNGEILWDKNRATPERQCHRNLFQGKYCTGTIAPIVCRQSNSDCMAASSLQDKALLEKKMYVMWSSDRGELDSVFVFPGKLRRKETLVGIPMTFSIDQNFCGSLFGRTRTTFDNDILIEQTTKLRSAKVKRPTCASFKRAKQQIHKRHETLLTYVGSEKQSTSLHELAYIT